MDSSGRHNCLVLHAPYGPVLWSSLSSASYCQPHLYSSTALYSIDCFLGTWRDTWTNWMRQRLLNWIGSCIDNSRWNNWTTSHRHAVMFQASTDDALWLQFFAVGPNVMYLCCSFKQAIHTIQTKQQQHPATSIKPPETLHSIFWVPEGSWHNDIWSWVCFRTDIHRTTCWPSKYPWGIWEFHYKRRVTFLETTRSLGSW